MNIKSIVVLTLISSVANGVIFDDKVPDYVLNVGKLFQIANSGYPSSYLTNLEFGYDISANDNYMVVGGGTSDTTGCVGVFKWNATANGYNELVYSHLGGQYHAAAVSIARDSNDFIVYKSGSGNQAMAYRVTGEFSSVVTRTISTGTTTCDSDFPCKSVSISPNGINNVAGWPSQLEGASTFAQRGFVRMYNTCGASSCNALSSAWPDGSTASSPFNAARGKDGTSYFGQSITTSDDTNNVGFLAVAGAPGNSEQDYGAGHTVYDYGGLGKYGGYFSTMILTSGATRVLQREWAPDGTTTNAIGNKFGAIVKLTPDGQYLLVTAPGHKVGAEIRGAFYVYQNVQNSLNGQDGFALWKGPYVGPVADENFGWSGYINSDATRVFIGAPEANLADGKIYSYTYGDGEFNLQGDFVDETPGAAGKLGVSLHYNEIEDKLYAGVPFTGGYAGYNNIGKVVGYDVPIAPTPFPTASPTPPTPAPTPSPTPNPYIVVGKAEIQYNVKNGVARQQIAQSTVADVKAKYSDPSSLSVRVKSTETSYNPITTYQLVNNQTLYEESYAKARGCWPECTASVTSVGGNRRLSKMHGRMLQTDSIEIEISFDLSEQAYNDLVASGNNLDDQDFINDLSSELGIHPDNVTITIADGEVIVEVSLVAEVTDEPTGQDSLDDIAEIKASLDNATTVLVEELGAPEDSVTTVTLDLCSNRDCNGYGDSSADGTDENGCTIATGACVCLNDRWGINCESACECINGGVCRNSICHCTYPYYGLKCNLDKSTDCNTCF